MQRASILFARVSSAASVARTAAARVPKEASAVIPNPSASPAPKRKPPKNINANGEREPSPSTLVKRVLQASGPLTTHQLKKLLPADKIHSIRYLKQKILYNLHMDKVVTKMIVKEGKKSTWLWKLGEKHYLTLPEPAANQPQSETNQN